MNKKLMHFQVILAFTAMIFISCQSTGPSIEEPVEPAQSVEPAPVEAIQQDENTTEEPEQEVVVNDETGFEISKEEYEKTRDEIRELINTLNSIISSKNYTKWKLFLSDSYIKTYNDPVKLKQISEQSQILSENNIVLTNLQDYFEWVVVPSRSSARVDDIVFSDDSHLIVYMKIKEKNTILYQLESLEENWQISVW